jgi:AcrR family transcriptional regulator
MSTASYHHGNLRQALVDEAVAVTRESGPEAIKVRDLARRVGVSHNAAYGHFANRDDLLAAVADHAYQGLVEAMQRRVDAVDTVDPVLRARRRLTEIGRAYVEFALAEPGLFRAASTAPPIKEALQAAGGPYVLLGTALDELVAVGFLSPAARPGAEATCWSAVHGFSCLNIEGPLASSDPEARAATLNQILATIDRSYAATTGATVAEGDLF